MEREREKHALWGRACCPSSRILDGGKQQHIGRQVHLCWPPRQSTAPRSRSGLRMTFPILCGDDSDALPRPSTRVVILPALCQLALCRDSAGTQQ